MNAEGGMAGLQAAMPYARYRAPSEEQETAELQASHNEYETIAQAVCTSMAVTKSMGGWTFAIQRRCSGPDTCVQICASKFLHTQDPQTTHRQWSTLGAIHVYGSRPSSSVSTVNSPHIGFKVYWSSNYHTGTSCGPNYCCCHAA